MFNEKMYDLGNRRSIIREIFEFGKNLSAKIGSENVFDFSLGNPSVEPPKEVSVAIKGLLDGENLTSLHGYTSAQGDLNVRTAISNSINERFGVNTTANNIYMTCGAASSLTITLKAVLNPGDECVVFAPFFTEYRVFVENAGGKLVVSKPNENDFQIDFADFENKISNKTHAVIINSPNNPSGVVYTENTIIKLSNILKEKSAEYGHNIFLITDEPYRELVYDDVKVPYLMKYYDDSVVCYSFSKSLSLPGERIGYIAVNPNATESQKLYLAICGAGRSLGYVCAPSLFQKVISKCLGCKTDIEKYKENRDLLYSALTKYGFNCVKPDGAFYLFVKSPNGDEMDFYEKAKKYNILIVPCEDFGVKGYVRIAYCVKKETIEKSLPGFQSLADEFGL